MDTTGMNSKKIALLIAVLAAIGLITGLAIWYVTSKAEEATISSNPNTGDNENSTVSNTNSSQEEEDTNSNQEEEDTNSNQEEEINMWFNPSKEAKHFELFVRIFRSKLKNELESLFKDQPYKDIRDDLEPLLYIINYDHLVNNRNFSYLNSNEIFKSTEVLLYTSKFKTCNIQDATEEDAKKMLKKVLKSPKVIKRLIISHKDIQGLYEISLLNFKFMVLPKVFGVFKGLKNISIDYTGVKNIEALNEAINLCNISAWGNRIEAIPEFKNLTNLRHLSLLNNPIQTIPTDFATNHSNLDRDGGVKLSSPGNGFNFSKKIKDIANNSNCIIKIYS